MTHHRRMGYVIIHKPNLSGRESINSRCRHFDLLLFRRFGCRRYDRSYRRSCCRWSMGRCRPTVMQLSPLFDRSLTINRGRSLVHSNKHSRGRHGFRKFFGWFLLGRTETRTCDRMRLFFGVRIRLGMTFNYLILWVRVKGQG